jgi:tRNA-splicing ligase RtcB (3'-phosphate/5'-hydroxy nucleic acid ligase)
MKITNLLLSPVQPRSKEPSIATRLQSITLPEGAGWVTRKGACLAHAQQPVIIPGSMGAPSYLLVGIGNKDWCASASHGVGRLRSRFDLSRQGNKESEEQLGLTGVHYAAIGAAN